MKKLLFIVSLFAIAMGLLEAAVVIYLRELLYPEGFSFPLSPISDHLILTELLRELATLIMLLMTGMLAGKKVADRFAWFLYSFAIWDIFYYAFLKALIGWPESLLTWDVLFLIPTTWTGPVISPVLISLLMIAFALLILISENRKKAVNIRLSDWILLITGSIVVIIAFTTDYSQFILKEFSLKDIFSFQTKNELMEYANRYIPVRFPWLTFSLGFILIAGAITRMSLRWNNTKQGGN